MTPLFERRISEFVDREAEIRRFCCGLDGKGKPVMMVHGDGGLGKSSLLARMIHEVARRRLRRAEVVWTDTRRHDYLAVMRKIRDDLGAEHFKSFTDLVNIVTMPQHRLAVDVGDVRVAEGAKIKGSHVGDLAGAIIKDSTFIIPRMNIEVPREERMVRFTDAFISDLARLLQVEPAVIFFDAIEKMSEDTNGWISGEIIPAVADGRLANLRVVLLGRRALAFTREERDVVDEAQLKPLERQHILEYLARRGVPAGASAVLADMMLVVTQGHPLQLATYVDSYLQLTLNRAAASAGTASTASHE